VILNQHPDSLHLVFLKVNVFLPTCSLYMTTTWQWQKLHCCDDIIFYAASRNNSGTIKTLQSQIYIAVQWFHQWKITINPTKTTAIIFSNKQVQNDELVKFRDTPIKWENKIKYLGITIDKNLNFSSHVQNIVTKTKGAKFSLFPLINFSSILSIDSKFFIFKTYIRSIITFRGTCMNSLHII